jgi:hypothetical protein
MRVKPIASRTSVLFLLTFGILLTFHSAIRADDNSDDSSKATGTPTPEVETPPLFLAEIKNEVYVIHNGNKAKADPPQELVASDRIVTGKDGKAYLEFQSGGTVEIGSQGDVKISQLDINPKSFKAKFLMAVGKMKTILHKLTSASSSFEIEAGGVVSGVRGTTFEVDYDKDKSLVATKTFEGSVFTRSHGKEQTVEKGFGLVIGKSGSPVLTALGEGDLADFATFIDASTDLEKRKEIIIKQLIKKTLENQLKDKAQAPKSPLDLQFHF